MAEPADVRRLFVAVWPDAEVRRRLAEIGRRIPTGRARPTHPDDLHLTLQFLGVVPAVRFPCLVEAVGAVSRTAPGPVELRLDRLGYWRRPRILWCGPQRTPAGLVRLVDRLGERLAGCGYPPEHRRFAAHVTLARKCPAAVSPSLGDIEPIAWEVGELALVESLSVPRPPRYRVVQRWPLRDATGKQTENSLDLDSPADSPSPNPN